LYGEPVLSYDILHDKDDDDTLTGSHPAMLCVIMDVWCMLELTAAITQVPTKNAHYT
jgi:hypothetical protein